MALLPHIGDNEEMIEVTEPQIWAIIGVMVAALAAILTIVTQSFNRSIDALGERLDTKFDSLHTEMVVRFEQVDKRFEQVDKRFEQVDKRFEQIDQRFEQIDKRFDRLEGRVDDLDRDMQSVVKRVFPPE